ncbi:MAG: outer membrane lipoprotein chaperone LolA [Pseudomonadota bacterium]
MIERLSQNIVLLCLALGCAQLGAMEPLEGLRAKLAGLDGVVADFTQVSSDAQGGVLEEASGQLWLSRPHFRWEVTSPYLQTIVADAVQVRIYDPDLEQVTEKELSDSVESTPLTLLTQPDLDLAAEYRVVSRDIGEASVQYILYPKSSESLFAAIEIMFEAEALYALAIRDHTGQQTVITFSQFRAQQVIQSERFELELPADVDIFRG